MLGEIFLNITTAAVFLAALYVSYWYVSKRRLGHLPPGPPALPIIGSLPWLAGPDIREVLRDMGLRYGNIFTIYLGGQRTVILNDADVIRDAFIRHHESFVDRPQDLFLFKELTKGLGVVSSNGLLWSKQRAFAHNLFREFGVTSSVLESKILEEVEPMMTAITASDKPIDPHHIIQGAVANIIGSFVWGERRDYDDPKFVKFITTMTDSILLLGSSGPLTVFPFLKYLPGDLFQYHRLMDMAASLKDDHRQEIKDQIRSHQPGDRRSFIDAYLEHMMANEDDTALYFDEKKLLQLLQDLYGAGTETTATTLVWCIAYMLRYPAVHERIRAEVDEVIGSSRLPSAMDRLQMPYTDACLLEIQRKSDIVPLGVPRATTHDIIFHGYDIPENTTVMPSLYSVHRDPKVFHEPYKFDPERFLKDGKVYGRDRIMPFSIGKRNCLGEAIARMELFLVFVCMIQRLEFRLPDGDTLPEEDGIITMAHACKSFRVSITRR